MLVCLGISISLVMTSLKSSLTHRRQTNHLLRVEQTDWLLEAGLVRAHRQLREDDAYTGETWSVSDAIRGDEPAEIEIEVTRDDASEDSLTIRVIARLGQQDPENPRRIQRSNTWQIASELSPTTTLN
ncbi:hypothetical protein RBSWK_03981 [Rhodopirellula baltica SWK14]|uniref:Uncharacterized protein n=2 Tax=Rhodopirellula baltica TaxID=265606 RepID=L7CF94_RHOBT|nr:hypothetical protein RBSWK_03981 [Rhodopirellula baltica SWK14]